MISSINSLFEYSIDDKIFWDTDRLLLIERRLPKGRYEKLQDVRKMLLNRGTNDENLIEMYNKLKELEDDAHENHRNKCTYRLYMAVLQLKLKNYRKAKEYCKNAKWPFLSNPEITGLKVYIEKCEKEANRPTRFRPGTKKAFAAASIVACIATASLMHYIFNRRRL